VLDVGCLGFDVTEIQPTFTEFYIDVDGLIPFKISLNSASAVVHPLYIALRKENPS
jgi:shikimate kinase